MRYTKTPKWLLVPREGAIRRVAKRERLKEVGQQDVDYIVDLLCRAVDTPLRPLTDEDVKASMAHWIDETQAKAPWWQPTEHEKQVCTDMVRYRHQFLQEFTLGKMPGRVTIDQAHFNGRRLYFNRGGKDSRKTAALRDKAVVESKQFVDAAWARIIRGTYYPD